MAGETILSGREWYGDHLAVVEAHELPAMVLMIKITSDGYKGVTSPYFVVNDPGTKSTHVKIGWRNHSLCKRMV